MLAVLQQTKLLSKAQFLCRLDWECGKRTTIEEFKKFDCNWQGSFLEPRSMKPRKERELNVGNKDCWWDSVELREV